MAQFYTAAKTQNRGSKAWSIDFRHPLRADTNNKPGRKIRRGLGTEDAQEADRLVVELNALLTDQSLWSLGAQAEAAKRYKSKVVDIFYDEIAPQFGLSVDLRDKLLPLPGRSDGYARVALMGVPGAGKTTLVRQLIGTHPDSERFPSTSVNRTTTFPTEVVIREGDHYEAVVTFMTEHETRFEIEEVLSSAIVEAVDGDSQKTAQVLLEKSDMRFRLKYLLGDYAQDRYAEIDPYEDAESADQNDRDVTTTLSSEEKNQNAATLAAFVDRILDLSKKLRGDFEAKQGAIESMSPQDRNAALDLIQELAINDDEFSELVSEILDVLRTKFSHVWVGRYDKTTTGWPKAWYIKYKASEREHFLRSIRYFSGISYESWGKLLTPLVNGMRVAGPFKPVWAEQAVRLVIVDTEGLGHKANTTADLPEEVLTLLQDADVVLLVDNAQSGMTNFATGKALEGIVNTGNTRKLAVLFTHMDAVKGENLKGHAKLEHVFGGLRNVIENQLAKNVSTESARYLLERLKKHTFYVGRIGELDPKPAKPELLRLLVYLSSVQPPIPEPVAFPKYSPDNLVLAIQEAARNFRQRWQGTLGLAEHAEFKPKAWQTIKALSRRYAEGWGDDRFVLQPVSNLSAALSSAVSRFLETPIGWSGNPTSEQKRETIDRIKSEVAKQLPKLSRQRLREQPQPVWHEAYSLRGFGSTFDRRLRIEGIYERWVPIPNVRGDALAFEFLNEVKAAVFSAVDAVESGVRAADSKREKSMQD